MKAKARRRHCGTGGHRWTCEIETAETLEVESRASATRGTATKLAAADPVAWNIS